MDLWVIFEQINEQKAEEGALKRKTRV